MVSEVVNCFAQKRIGQVVGCEGDNGKEQGDPMRVRAFLQTTIMATGRAITSEILARKVREAMSMGMFSLTDRQGPQCSTAAGYCP